jgi:hypothetical protein
MFQQMLNASRAILLHPSVATFEEHERSDLGWALIYTAIAAVISAFLGASRAVVVAPAAAQQLNDLERQFQDQTGQPLPPFAASLLGNGSVTATIIFALFGAIIGFLIYLVIVYLLGLLFGGTGAFGELAYDISLFSAPLTVITGLVSLLGIGPLVCITGLVNLALGIYSLYLTYLGIQAGMNLPGNKALLVILIPIIVVVLLCCGLSALIVLVLSGASQ